MTERDQRRRLASLSVLSLSSLAFGASWLIVVHEDEGANTRAAIASTQMVVAAEPSVQQAPAWSTPPVAGLRPVTVSKRRVVVVRRSRAS